MNIEHMYYIIAKWMADIILRRFNYCVKSPTPLVNVHKSAWNLFESYDDFIWVQCGRNVGMYSE